MEFFLDLLEPPAVLRFVVYFPDKAVDDESKHHSAADWPRAGTSSGRPSMKD
jgi:hypothetical protein